MQLLDINELREYLSSNYTVVYSSTERFNPSTTEVDGFCDSCGKEVFFRVSGQYYGVNMYGSDVPYFLYLRRECPKCKRISFLQLIVIKYDKPLEIPNDLEDDIEEIYEVYKLNYLPTQEESYIANDIPTQYTSLIKTAIEAKFCVDHGKNISAAIMFRRAIQVIAKDILGAPGKNLYNQLEWLKNNKNKLGVDLTELFHDNSKIIKDVGNQGAHPEEDITLQDFTQEDVDALHDLFVTIINEIFVKPEKLKQLKDDLLKRRKIK